MIKSLEKQVHIVLMRTGIWCKFMIEILQYYMLRRITILHVEKDLVGVGGKDIGEELNSMIQPSALFIFLQKCILRKRLL